MKLLSKILESVNAILNQNGSKGTYAAVRPHPSQMHTLIDFMHSHGIANPEPTDKLHTTLLYSRKYLPEYVPDRSLEHPAIPTKFEIWKTKSGKNCLVLLLNCPSLEDRHKYLMDFHGATYDFDKYKTHISLSYDAGDVDLSKLDVNNLPFMQDEPYCLYLTNEYSEELDTDGK